MVDKEPMDGSVEVDSPESESPTTEADSTQTSADQFLIGTGVRVGGLSGLT